MCQSLPDQTTTAKRQQSIATRKPISTLPGPASLVETDEGGWRGRGYHARITTTNENGDTSTLGYSDGAISLLYAKDAANTYVMLGREERFSSECATGKQPPAFHVPSEMWEAGDESAAHTALRGLEEEYSKAHADLLRREHGSNNKPPDRYAGTTPVYASECDVSAQAMPHGPTH